jgi:hypothetical protein
MVMKCGSLKEFQGRSKYVGIVADGPESAHACRDLCTLYAHLEELFRCIQISVCHCLRVQSVWEL